MSTERTTRIPSTAAHPAWGFTAALLGLSAVALGAIAAHAVADAQAARALERASLYQLIHALALLYATGLPGKAALLARSLLLAGIVLFCGSIELKYLFSLTQASAVAPAGGVALMLGWLLLGVAGLARSVSKS
ncbi:MAG: DUF423 domain-containing protein [Alcaligenaceae bacterium]